MSKVGTSLVKVGTPLKKMSKRCQVVKKMSNVKKSNTWTMEEVHKKIIWHNDTHTY